MTGEVRYNKKAAGMLPGPAQAVSHVNANAGHANDESY